MRVSSIVTSAIAGLVISAGLTLAAPKAEAHGYYGGWGPSFVVRVGPPAAQYYGPPAYRYYGPRLYYYGYRPYVYAPGAYDAPPPYYYGYRPFHYWHPRRYYVAPVIGFGVTIR